MVTDGRITDGRTDGHSTQFFERVYRNTPHFKWRGIIMNKRTGMHYKLNEFVVDVLTKHPFTASEIPKIDMFTR